MNTAQIKTVLFRMVELLLAGGNYDWSLVLANLASEISNDPSAAGRKILSLYGGAGSLNDVVLYDNGKPLVSDNDEFDKLRSSLFALCHA